MLALVGLIGAGASPGQAVQTTRCGSTDLVLVVDLSGSMGLALAELKDGMAGLVERLDALSGGAFRIGLITYRDRVQVRQDLVAAPAATQRTALEAALEGLEADGGGSPPEAWDEALNTVINRLAAGAGRPQRGDFAGRFDGRSRSVVLLTDDLPGGFDDRFQAGVDDRRVEGLIEQAGRQGIAVSSIRVPTGVEAPVLDRLLENFQRTTGGLALTTGRSGKGAARALSEIVENCGRIPLS